MVEFIWPAMLLLLLFIPLLIALYVRNQRRRRQIIASFHQYGLAAPKKMGGLRSVIVPVFFLLGLTGLLVAAARPQTQVSLPRREGTIILAFDVSGSMSADDIKPTRMEAAKAAVRDFVDRQPNTIQIGVVAFSDSGFSVQRPTNNKDDILAAINRLTPQRGTSLGNGITASLNTIASGNAANWTQPKVFTNLTPTPTVTPTPVPQGTHIPAVIILLTDGDNNENPDPNLVAQASSDRGVRIFTIGVGSETGSTVKVNGFTVHTQLNADLLKAISAATDGQYYNAQSEKDLQTIYESINPQFVIKPEKTEVTALIAGASLLVFLLAGVVSLFWFGRLP